MLEIRFDAITWRPSIFIVLFWQIIFSSKERSSPSFVKLRHYIFPYVTAGNITEVQSTISIGENDILPIPEVDIPWIPGTPDYGLGKELMDSSPLGSLKSKEELEKEKEALKNAAAANGLLLPEEAGKLTLSDLSSSGATGVPGGLINEEGFVLGALQSVYPTSLVSRFGKTIAVSVLVVSCLGTVPFGWFAIAGNAIELRRYFYSMVSGYFFFFTFLIVSLLANRTAKESLFIGFITGLVVAGAGWKSPNFGWFLINAVFCFLLSTTTSIMAAAIAQTSIYGIPKILYPEKPVWFYWTAYFLSSVTSLPFYAVSNIKPLFQEVLFVTLLGTWGFIGGLSSWAQILYGVIDFPVDPLSFLYYPHTMIGHFRSKSFFFTILSGAITIGVGLSLNIYRLHNRHMLEEAQQRLLPSEGMEMQNTIV